MNILEVKKLDKQFSGRQILKDVSFSIAGGEVLGFLGPNGAGKTTTIKIICGLIGADSGEVSICGHDIRKERIQALRELGAIVENPSVYGDLSGYENLQQAARIRKVSRKRIDDVVEIIGLKDRIHDKVRKYSLGMKQRVGVGLAILGSPKMLILDEPTNGLDPMGIIEFRQVVKDFVDASGAAVLISSHILAEVENICDSVAFISHGEIKAMEKMGQSQDGESMDLASIVVANPEELQHFLSQLPYMLSAERADASVVARVQKGHSQKMLQEVLLKGFHVDEFKQNRMTLEERFLEIMKGA